MKCSSFLDIIQPPVQKLVDANSSLSDRGSLNAIGPGWDGGERSEIRVVMISPPSLYLNHCI